MSNKAQNVTYQHFTVEGTSYEIGKKQAELMKEHCPEYVVFLFQGNEHIRPVPEQKAKEIIRILDKYCPNLNEEIRGFADYFEKKPEEIIYYSFSYVSNGNCGHFAVLPQKTSDHKTYVGRSYEWSADDDKVLITTRAQGVYSHLGFSLLLFGRYDGINERGLCVTMSNGIPCMMSQEEGLRFWMVIRILLDRCKNVEEAIKLIKELPISSYCNLIITDQNQKAVLVEIHNAVKTFKTITSSDEEGYVCSTNHYNLPEMLPLVKNRMQHSMDRYQAILKTLDGDSVCKEELKQLLSTHMPGGLTCHYYSDGLGTLWSILYDVDQCKADICFGSPLVNKWHTFTLDSQEGANFYQAVLPNEEATPQTWMRV